MSSVRQRYNILLWVEGLGFLSLIVITWLDEGVLLPKHWLPAWFGPGGWHEAVLGTIAITTVGLAVIAFSNHLLKRIRYLEHFLRVCAWCHKVDLDGAWVPIETFLKSTSEIECSHGICEACAEVLKHEAAASLKSTGLMRAES